MATASAYTVETHFTGKSLGVRQIYHALLSACQKIGRVQEDAKKTSIHIVCNSALAGVEVRKDYLLVNLKSDHALKSPRIPKSEQLSAKRFHQKVKLCSPKEVDGEFKRWLKHAYEISE